MQDSEHIRHSASGVEFRLQEFLPYRLSRVSNLISRGIASTYQNDFGLSVAEWRVMAVIGGQPDLTASEVIGITAMDKVAVSRAVKTLVDRGLMARQIPDQDKRSRRLKLTEGGQQIYADVIQRALEYERRLLDQLNHRDLESFNRILGELEDMARVI